jgi:hypothetical protein
MVFVRLFVVIHCFKMSINIFDGGSFEGFILSLFAKNDMNNYISRIKKNPLVCVYIAPPHHATPWSTYS